MEYEFEEYPCAKLGNPPSPTPHERSSQHRKLPMGNFIQLRCCRLYQISFVAISTLNFQKGLKTLRTYITYLGVTSKIILGFCGPRSNLELDLVPDLYMNLDFERGCG